MNEQDNAAFEEWQASKGENMFFPREVWQAALEYAAEKAARAEPVAYTNKEQLGYLKDPKYSFHPMAMWASKSPGAGIELYTEAPAVAVNEQMLAVLKAAVSCGMVPTLSARSGGACAHAEQLKVADQIRDAIAAAEAAKGGV